MILYAVNARKVIRFLLQNR